MNPKALKYILDIESVIAEMNSVKELVNHDFKLFETDTIAIRAVERHFEIIGEAVLKLEKVEPSFRLTHAKSIIGLRNMIAHAYDSIDNGILWGILINHIPQLQSEIAELKKGY